MPARSMQRLDRRPQRQRHVDRAADRRDERLSGAAGLRYAPIIRCARRPSSWPSGCRIPRRESARGRRIRARLPDRRHAVRGARLLLCRPDRRAQFRAPAAGAEECSRHGQRAGADPRRHPEGQGLRARRGSADKYHGVNKFDVITGAQAKAPANAPSYTKVFAESLVREARGGRPHRRDHRRDALRHRARPVRRGVSRRASSMSASPSSMPLPSPPALPPKASSRSPRSTRPSCSAPMTRWCMTSRSRSCRCAFRSTAPVSSAPTGRPIAAPSTPAFWPRCPALSSWRRPTRPS